MMIALEGLENLNSSSVRCQMGSIDRSSISSLKTGPLRVVLLIVNNLKLEVTMSYPLINFILPTVIAEIDNALDEYPEYPYQVAFSMHELRQKLGNCSTGVN
jgi:hypothetical protein